MKKEYITRESITNLVNRMRKFSKENGIELWYFGRREVLLIKDTKEVLVKSTSQTESHNTIKEIKQMLALDYNLS